MYVTQWPSRENATCSAEIPERKGANWLVCGSKRNNSDRREVPIAKISLPSLLGKGNRKSKGPPVNWVGLSSRFRHHKRRPSATPHKSTLPSSLSSTIK